MKNHLNRVIIIGNSGSGKSYLAHQLESILNTPVIHLDKLFWESDDFSQKREKEIVHQEGFSSKPNGGVGGLLQGKWETIISKDQTKAIIDVSYEDLGLTDNCVHRSPVDFVNHCPEGKKFEAVAKYRKEEFKFTRL